MQWFNFQGIMLHAEDNIECTEEHLKSLLKVFSMFNINIIYYETIDDKDVPEGFGIICINCVKLLVVHWKIKRWKTSSLILSQIWCSSILVYFK